MNLGKGNIEVSLFFLVSRVEIKNSLNKAFWLILAA